ncbi:hypothetical protein H0E84_12110 [Luteimonas sp. SJ-92]|uniref:Outer membrane protein assembly factor BamE n=1 Tax=Luteimonas salinisoli TaxID=2752307 RepID=A0A853JEE3_9GAMM|nr:hypothetical protein [Luteimonas salinisoli]NZA27124.1 hypothetical protein [Luteimonas salinisoli]
MTITRIATIFALSLVLAACASGPQDATPTRGRAVQSQDGSFTGEVIGTAREGSAFARLQIGMDMQQTQEIMGGTPDRFHTYESGKRWIPFYFGDDARRMQALYKDSGCLIFTGGNVWGGAGGVLIQIEHDPAGDCYQP